MSSDNSRICVDTQNSLNVHRLMS